MRFKGWVHSASCNTTSNNLQIPVWEGRGCWMMHIYVSKLQYRTCWRTESQNHRIPEGICLQVYKNTGLVSNFSRFEWMRRFIYPADPSCVNMHTYIYILRFACLCIMCNKQYNSMTYFKICKKPPPVTTCVFKAMSLLGPPKSPMLFLSNFQSCVADNWLGSWATNITTLLL